MGKCPHTSTYTGKRVLIRMKDGTKFVAKFLEKKSGRVVLDTGSISVKNPDSMSIYRGKTHHK